MDSAITEFNQEWKDGDRVRAKAMAVVYINEHRGDLTKILGPMSLEEIVALISEYRKKGKESDRIVADMWLLSEYAPQHISGGINIGGKPAVAEAEAILREERTA